MRKTLPRSVLKVLVLIAICIQLPCFAQSHPTLGSFENGSDVGEVTPPGTAQYDPATKRYLVTSSGQNIWNNHDDFHFLWRKASGDVSLNADIAFETSSGNEHEKAVLMIRQSLDPDSTYADIALHANNWAALQYRTEKGGDTREIQFHSPSPKRLRIMKRGDYFYTFFASSEGDKLEPTGASIKIPLQGDFYVGIGLCSHDKDKVEKAAFSKVEFKTLEPFTSKQILYSTLETVTVGTSFRKVAYVSPTHFEAPNWTRDGSAFIFNRDGRLERLPVDGDSPVTIDTGKQINCNNDHGISPDSNLLAISDGSQPDHQSRVFIVPIGGGTPKLVTEKAPSYWHGWSPDGKTLAFVGQRDNEFDIYTIPVNGGDETRLTTAKGLDDGPEYSPAGKYLYFNSVRTGHMQIWRMNADGSDQQQVTHTDRNEWFPHISPDAKWMVYVSYEPAVEGHPPNKDVELHLMSLVDGKSTVLARLFGGQGTMNVPSWSPDSQKVAFVSYELISSEDVGGTAKK